MLVTAGVALLLWCLGLASPRKAAESSGLGHRASCLPLSGFTSPSSRPCGRAGATESRGHRGRTRRASVASRETLTRTERAGSGRCKLNDALTFSLVQDEECVPRMLRSAKRCVLIRGVHCAQHSPGSLGSAVHREEPRTAVRGHEKPIASRRALPRSSSGMNPG